MSQMAKMILKLIDNRLKAGLKSMLIMHILGLEKIKGLAMQFLY